jgi:hypothetical protein
MKTIKRMALGTLSSLLLCAGLTRAAQKLDPLSNMMGEQDFGPATNEPAGACVFPCLFQPE